MGDGILDSKFLSYPTNPNTDAPYIFQDQTSPNLAHIPTTNVLLYSNDFSKAQWLKLSGSSIGNRVISPDGTLNGWEIIFDGTSNGRIEQARTGMSSGENYSVSVFARVSSGTQTVDFGSVNTATYTLNTEWQRLTRMEAENDTVSYSRLLCNDSATIEIFGFQLEEQSQATAYIKSDGIPAVRKSSTTNLVPYSEDFTNSEWNPNAGTTITPNYAISPNGSLNASRYLGIGTSGIGDKLTLNAVSHTLSFFVKSNNGVNQFCRLIGESSNVSSDLLVTTEWTRLSYTFTASGLSDKTNGIFRDSNNNDIDILIYGAQLEEQTQAETYAPTKGIPVTIDLFKENNYGHTQGGIIQKDVPRNS
jgi:hypothetical protein